MVPKGGALVRRDDIEIVEVLAAQPGRLPHLLQVGYTDKLKPGMTATELSEMEASFRQQLVKTYSAIRQEYKKTYPNESNADDAYFMQAARFQVRLEELRQTVAATPTSTKPKIVDEEMQVLLGLGQTLVWPLLLAFALALRLAKVTVDVFGWAE
jgi:hypothetical protein